MAITARSFLICALVVLAADAAFVSDVASAPSRSRRAITSVAMQVFKTPQSTDVAAQEQAARAAKEGMSPREYAVSTRLEANEYLASNGAHQMEVDASVPPQRASFLRELWDVDSVPGVPAAAMTDPSRVLATVYEIGGPLTNVLSTSVAKTLPLIPHVGIRVHGVEYFYSDHIECRTVPVMEEMLGDRPQVTLDLGPSRLSLAELEAEVANLEADWEAKDYHVFDKNCVHFADVLAARVTADGGSVTPMRLDPVAMPAMSLDLPLQPEAWAPSCLMSM